MTSCPASERWSAVGQPQKPSPPTTRIFFDGSAAIIVSRPAARGARRANVFPRSEAGTNATVGARRHSAPMIRAMVKCVKAEEQLQSVSPRRRLVELESVLGDAR